MIVNLGDFQGIMIAPGLRITHLLFIDDVIIFFSGQDRDDEKLAEILNLFCFATGMQINPNKSTLSLIEMEGGVVETYQGFFPYHT
jgi:hypothetical protein